MTEPPSDGRVRSRFLKDGNAVRRLQAQRLTPKMVRQAYALVQVSMPEVALSDWLAFAKPLAASRSNVRGIMSVLDERAYILGLCRYRVERGLAQRRTLIADHVIVLDLFDHNVAAETLVDGIEALAQKLDCGAVNIHVPHTDLATPKNRLAELLLSSGHRLKAYQMHKPISETKASAQ